MRADLAVHIAHCITINPGPKVLPDINKYILAGLCIFGSLFLRADTSFFTRFGPQLEEFSVPSSKDAARTSDQNLRSLIFRVELFVSEMLPNLVPDFNCLLTLTPGFLLIKNSRTCNTKTIIILNTALQHIRKICCQETLLTSLILKNGFETVKSAATISQGWFLKVH